eukprot:14920516-Alexandrium_andersonii.AAC.1
MELRRDGFPVIWSEFKRAWSKSRETLGGGTERFKQRNNLGELAPEDQDCVACSAYFQVYTSFVDLLFAVQLQGHADFIRKQAERVCKAWLFGGETIEDGKCRH